MVLEILITVLNTSALIKLLFSTLTTTKKLFNGTKSFKPETRQKKFPVI